MNTEIAFLQELREDLMDAAALETSRTRATPRLRVIPSRSGVARRSMSRWKVLTACTAALLVAAGVVGYVFDGTDGSGSAERAAGPVPGAAMKGPVRWSAYAPAITDRSAGVDAIMVPGPAALPPSGRVRLPGGVPDVGPNVIKTADISLEVPQGDFDERFDAANAIAEQHGGYVQSSTTAGTKQRSGSMVMRVPADQFAQVLGELQALGTTLRIQREGVDVTSRFVDLGARLRNADAQEESLRRLLAKAPDVASTLKVNNALSDAELQIEELRGQLRLLQNRTDLASVRIEMAEKGAARETGVVPKPKLGKAFDHAVAGFLGVIFSIVVGIGYLLPILAVVGVAWFVVRRVRRMRRARALAA